jgi:hypothetical protein
LQTGLQSSVIRFSRRGASAAAVAAVCCVALWPGRFWGWPGHPWWPLLSGEDGEDARDERLDAAERACVGGERRGLPHLDAEARELALNAQLGELFELGAVLMP